MFADGRSDVTAAVRRRRRTDTRCSERPPLGRGAAGSPASAPELLPLLQLDAPPGRSGTRLLQDVCAGAESADGNLAAYHSEYPGSFTPASLLISAAAGRPAEDFHPNPSDYLVFELKWPNDGCWCRGLDAGGGGGGICADWNASLLPRLLEGEQGEKRRSENVYEFYSRHFNLEPRKNGHQKKETPSR